MVRTMQIGLTLVLVAALTPAVALAENGQVSFGPEAGDWEFTLLGSGTNDKEFENGGFSMGGSIGYFLTETWEVVLRQSVTFADVVGESSWSGATRVALDYHFDFDRIQPYVGVNIGGFYGDDVADTGAGGPELGVKWYVKPETFIFVHAEYQFLFESGDDIDNSFDDGVFLYGVGIGLNF